MRIARDIQSHYFRRRLFGLLLGCAAILYGAAPSVANSAHVYVIDTAKQEHSMAFAQAVNQNCRSCQPVKYMDMQGDYRLGRKIVADLKTLRNNGTLDLLITLGTPATRLIAGSIDDVPIFPSLSGDKSLFNRRRQNIVDVDILPPVALQLQALQTMAPDIRSVGFLATQDSLAPIREEAQAAANKLGLHIKFYYVNQAFDMPSGLRTAIQEMDALLFVRDPVAVNGDTLNYILQMTLENQIPTLGYSGRLVERGMLAALTPNPERFGEKLGAALQVYLETGMMPAIEHDPSLFQLNINNATIKQTPLASPLAPAGVKLVMR